MRADSTLLGRAAGRPVRSSRSFAPPRFFIEPRELVELLRRTGCVVAVVAATSTARAQPPTPAPGAAASAPGPSASAAVLDKVTVIGNYANGIGTSDAASAGIVTSKLIESRPALRTGELLEFVPGVIVTAHSGDGKANQYFLRGFNLDHGTDFATFVDGVAVNARTNAHGQGYSDLNFLIPELVDRIEYKKGPYFADEGDFASAGAAHINLLDTLPTGIASLTVGADAYGRAVLADSLPLIGGNLLWAVEAAHNNGPWKVAEGAHHLSGQLRYSFGDADNRSSITAMAYGASWHATDQIPLRAVQSGQIDRFGSISPSDGGEAERYSVSYKLERNFSDGGAFKLNAYVLKSRLDLFNDFTYFLDNPVTGDQFEQSEKRLTLGAATSRSFVSTLFGQASTTTLGLQARQDRLSPVGLYSAVEGVRTGVTQEADVRETSAAVYAENATTWSPWFRSVVGARYDRFRFDVASSIAQNSGKVGDGLASPKLALVFGPWLKTEYFVDYGWGYHSNDARGVTSTVAPVGRDPIASAPGLVRSKGAELGLRTEIVPGLQSSLALWALNLDSELVFSGDAGDTEPSGATHRRGIEFSNHYIASKSLLFDLDVSISKARFTSDQGDAPNTGRDVPGSVNKVVSLGATVSEYGPWFGHVGLRYFGPRPLIEDGSQQSKSTTLAYARVGYNFTKDTKVSLDVFNIFDRKASDIDYYYRSRLPGEPAAGVGDIHFHPAEPREFRVTLSSRF